MQQLTNLNSYKIQKELESILFDLKMNLRTCDSELLAEGIKENIRDIEDRLRQLNGQ